MNITINLNADEYDSFLKCLVELKDICDDVDIREGYIRQRCNSHTTVFEINLNPIIGEINIPLSDLKQKIDILKLFSGRETVIEVNDEEFSFSDEISSIKFKNPSLEFMNNKFMPIEERDSIFLINEDDLILEDELSTTVSERIKVTTQVFNSTAVQVEFYGETATLTAKTQSKDQTAKLNQGMVMNIPIENCYSNLPTNLFSIDHDTSIKFEMFKETDNDVSINKLSTTIGDIDVNMYSRSSIMTEVEDEDEAPF